MAESWGERRVGESGRGGLGSRQSDSRGGEIPFEVNAQYWAFRGISVNAHGILFVAMILDRA